MAQADRRQRGWTLLEVTIVCLVIVVLAGIGIPVGYHIVQDWRINKVLIDMQTMERDIRSYKRINRQLPISLDAIGWGERKDAWGRPYQYLSFATVKGKGKLRKDKSLVPINTDFDLYSLGPDGKSAPPLTAKHSRDDIIRANDGEYYGTAEDY